MHQMTHDIVWGLLTPCICKRNAEAYLCWLALHVGGCVPVSDVLFNLDKD